MSLRKTARHALRMIVVLMASAAAAAFTSAAATLSPHTGILPPDNPQYSLGVLEYLWPMCSGARDYSVGCMEPSLAMLNAGRLGEGLGPAVLPSNWQQLTVAEQLFVLTELERTARGLPADTGLAADWNAAAQTGADAGQDPTSDGSGARGFQAVWAGGQPNAIVVMADWIYADGVFPDGSSQNLGCLASTGSGCWSHRDIVLHDTAATACHSRCAVGAAFSADGFSGAGANRHESYAEIFGTGGGNNSDPLDFTWLSEQQALPPCERARDSCSWAGIDVATASGIRAAGGGPSHDGEVGQPSFAVRVSRNLRPSGDVVLMIRTNAHLLAVGVRARHGHQHVVLRVRRRSMFLFRVSGRLTPGRWMLTIRYRQTRGRWARPVSTRRLMVR